jgi:hypothetical protein
MNRGIATGKTRVNKGVSVVATINPNVNKGFAVKEEATVNHQKIGINGPIPARATPWLDRIAVAIGVALLIFPFVSHLLPAPVRAYLGAIFR